MPIKNKRLRKQWQRKYYIKNRKSTLRKQKLAYKEWKESFTPEEFFDLNRKYVLLYRYKLTPIISAALEEDHAENVLGGCCVFVVMLC